MNDLNWEVKSSTLQLLAGNEKTASQNLAAISNEFKGTRVEVAKLQNGLNVVSMKLDAVVAGIESVAEGVRELNATVERGFDEVISIIGAVNDNLQVLIGIARSPSQTWCYEQFDIARDAFRRGLFEEALEYLDRAINGHGPHVGYKLEFRFYDLLGLIKLGSHRNHSESIVNLQAARDAYLLSVKYSQHDHPKEAARALCSAGWAEYCMGNAEKCLEFSMLGLRLNARLSEAKFQIAKSHCSLNRWEAAAPYFVDLLKNDVSYALKCASDRDFDKYAREVEGKILSRRNEFAEFLQPKIKSVEEAVNTIQETPLTKDLDAPAQLRNSLVSAKSLYDSGSLLGVLHGYDVLSSGVAAFRATLPNLELAMSRRKNSTLQKPPDSEKMAMNVAIVAFILVQLFYQLQDVIVFTNWESPIYLIFAIAGRLIVISIPSLIVAVPVYFVASLLFAGTGAMRNAQNKNNEARNAKEVNAIVAMLDKKLRLV